MKVGCFHCDARMPVGESFCPRCGHPTPFASYDERQGWEVLQWRGSRPAATARVHAATMTVQRRPETIVVPEAQPSRPVRPALNTVEFPRIGALRPTAAPVRSAQPEDQLTRIVELLQEMSGRIDALAGRLDETQPRRRWIRGRLRRP